MIPIIIDSIMLVIIGLMGYYSYRKGFMYSFVYLILYILALIATYFLSKFAASLIFEMFLKNSIIEQIASAISGYGTTIDVATLIPNILNSVPEFMRNAIHGALEASGINNILANATADNSTIIATTITDQILKNVILTLLNVILFMIIAFILMILVRFISSFFKGLNRIPVLGTANRILGSVMGIIQGVVFVVVIIVTLKTITILTNDKLSFLNSDILNETYVTKTISQQIPFLK